jgi:hypothetical protein
MSPSIKSPTPVKKKVELSFTNWVLGGPLISVSPAHSSRGRKVIITDSKSSKIVERGVKKDEVAAQKDGEGKDGGEEKEEAVVVEEKKEEKTKDEGEKKEGEEKVDEVRLYTFPFSCCLGFRSFLVRLSFLFLYIYSQNSTNLLFSIDSQNRSPKGRGKGKFSQKGQRGEQVHSRAGR